MFEPNRPFDRNRPWHMEYVAVYTHEGVVEEEFGRWDILHNRSSWDRESQLKGLAEKLIRRLGITTSRKNPEKVKVSVFGMEIVNGKIQRENVGSWEIQPSFKRMTDEEYNEEMKEILSGVAEEFRPFVESQSYDRGHSSGYEEVISIAQDIVEDLIPCIKEYRKNSVKV